MDPFHHPSALSVASIDQIMAIASVPDMDEFLAGLSPSSWPGRAPSMSVRRRSGPPLETEFVRRRRMARQQAFESDVLSQHPLTSAEALQQQVEQFLRDDAHAFFQFLLVSPKAENVWESSLLEDADWEERDEALLLMWDALDPMDRQSWINEATYIREYRAARIEEVRSNTQRRTVKFARPAADWNPPAPTLGICVDAGHDAFDWMDEEDSLERRVEDNLKAMLGDVESMDLPRTRGIKRGRAQDDVSGLECLGPADAGLDSKRRQISHLRTWTRCAPGSA